MFRTFPTLALTLAAVLTLTFSTRGQEDGPTSEEARRVRESIAVLNEVMSTSDTSIPTSITSKAEGIAIFPGTLKAGFIFGGMRGRGILSARTEDGWSVPTFMTLTGGSIGLQIGGQATDLVLVIMNRRGLEQFVRNQFKFGADASAAAGPVGRDAQANTDLQLRAEILSY
jgi:lipid-binding SYLF domain-containing protein